MTTVDKSIFVLTILAALGSCLIAGVFFAFSTSVMKALGRLPSSEGISAMQSINIVIINPLFLGVFLGTSVVCVFLAVSSIVRWQRPGAAWLLAGALLYVIGGIAVTMICNVPMNNALAAADSASANGQEIWANYLTNWTFWNHVRTGASLAAAGSFILALMYTR